MRKVRLWMLAALVMGAAIAAPASAASYKSKFTQGYTSKHLITKKTTMGEVRDLYGKPHDGGDVSVHSDGSKQATWTYDLNQHGFKGLLSKASSLVSDASSLSGGYTSGASDAMRGVNSAANTKNTAERAMGTITGADGDRNVDPDRIFRYLRVVFEDGVLTYYSLSGNP